jgi:TonB family protein
MMKLFNARLLSTLSLLTAILVSVSLCSAQTDPDNMPLTIIKKVEPQFPSKYNNTAVTSGYAKVIVHIDAGSQMDDSLLIECSELEFGDAALEAINGWVFQAPTRGGVPSSTTQEFIFNFSSQGGVVSQSSLDDVIQEVSGAPTGKMAYEVSRLKDLDSIPAPIKIESPSYPQSLIKDQVKGSVTVEFYIDESGKIRMPVVLEADKVEFAAEAIVAVKQWRFVSPLKGGKPVKVKVKQAFNFKPPAK